jgi:protein-S-isoprenylcysteine O-methyltransferase Ste14
VRSAQELVFRYREKAVLILFLAVVANLVHTGRTLGLSEAGEDWLAACGCLVAALGHALRVLALRQVGPLSRTTSRFQAPRLATDGTYAVVRNPLYLGNWLIAVGLCLVAQLRWLLVAGPILTFALYYLAALAEERHLLEQFGDEYLEYDRTTPRFFPRGLFTRRGWGVLFTAGGGYAVLRTKEYQAVLATGACVLLLELAEYLRRASGQG